MRIEETKRDCNNFLTPALSRLLNTSNLSRPHILHDRRMISCKSYRSAWVRLLLLCLRSINLDSNFCLHALQIRVCMTFVTFIAIG